MVREGGSSFPSLPLAPLCGRQVTTSTAKFRVSCGQITAQGDLPRFPFSVQRCRKTPSSQGAVLQPVCPHRVPTTRPSCGYPQRRAVTQDAPPHPGVGAVVRLVICCKFPAVNSIEERIDSVQSPRWVQLYLMIW